MHGWLEEGDAGLELGHSSFEDVAGYGDQSSSIGRMELLYADVKVGRDLQKLCRPVRR